MNYLQADYFPHAFCYYSKVSVVVHSGFHLYGFSLSSRSTSDREHLSQNICSAKKHRLLKRWDIRLYSYLLNVGIYVQWYRSQRPNDNSDNSGLNVPYSFNILLEVGVFLRLLNFFDHHIMITKNSHVDEKSFFVNDSDVWFGGSNDAVCLKVEIPLLVFIAIFYFYFFSITWLTLFSIQKD